MTMPTPFPAYGQKMLDRIGGQTRFVLVNRRQSALWLVSLLLALAGVLGAAPQAIYAQEPAFDVRHPFGPVNDKTNSVAVGDLNGDGHLDIVTGNHGEQNVVYLNDGAGNFTTARVFGPDNDATNSVAVGDLNGDGYLDIIIGNHGQNAVYLNDGAGNFATVRNFGQNNSVTNSVVVGDVNGDGHLDIIAGNNGQNVVYLNDGAGNFTTEQNFGTGSDSTASVAVGDVNGDGHLDIVTGNSGQIVNGSHIGEQNVVYLNDGAGNFSTPRSFGTGIDRTRSVAVGDLNGDGHLDIVTGNGAEPTPQSGPFVGEQNEVYLNDGTGNFSRQEFGPNDDNTSSVVVADLDGDGYLDILVGNREQQNLVYLNDGSATRFTMLIFGTGLDDTRGIAAGDMNGDGHLDLITGNVPQIDRSIGSDASEQRLVGGQNVVYLNNGAGDLSSTRDFGTGSDDTYSVAVGDVNGDGHLDIVIGRIPLRDGNNYVGGQNVVYLNDGAGHFSTVRPFGTGIDRTFGLAVGDVNGDGYLDIITGNISRRHGNDQAYVDGQNVVYLNDGAGNFPIGRPFGTDSDKTFSVAVGDMNGDGHLDIIAGNSTQRNFVYLNDGAGNFPSGRPFGTGNDITQSLAVGDMDGDGYLDIIAGDRGGQNWVYLNDGQGNFATGRPFGTGNDITQSVAVGDMDGDGYLDIVTANSRHPNIVYLNDGQGNFPTSRSFGSGNDDTNSVVVGDVDGDGHLDIITGNRGQSVVYLNDGKGHFSSSRDYGTGADYTLSVAVGDVDGDGQLDIIAGRKLSNMIFLNKMRRATGLPNHAPWLTVSRPVPTANANFFSSPVLLESMVIPISYTLFDREGDRVGRMEAFYSPDGDGRWLPAVAATGTITQHLATAPGGITYTFYWDTFASGFFGQSDYVVIRMMAFSQPSSASPANATYRYTNTVAGPYQWPYASATTFPFRVRGTQVRVTEDSQPVTGALVYRLPAGQVQGALPFGGARPFRTNVDGYLGGRGQIAIEDQLVALHPQSLPATLAAQMSDVLRFYHTSATPAISGLNAMTVSQPGVQALTVSTQTPLLLFDLKVALEWDARKDSQYLSQLEFNLKRASSLLYDWSNGQIALGQVTIYHNAPYAATVNGWQPWHDAHIRLYATNLLRPNASKGGVITDVYTETVASGKTITYRAGQIHMGAIWNRYGEASGNLGEDWPRALAHELAHYLLFLDDNYLGVDDRGRLITIPVEQCPGAMNNPYSDLNSEFHPQLDWLPGCQQTLSHQELGRSDWATIIAHYPMLKAPAGSFAQTSSAPAATAGPNLLPLAVTQVQFQSPITPAQALDAPIFSLIQPGGSAVVSGNGTRAYLYPANSQRIIDLGQPTLDQVLAHGARPGDRLCVYDPAAQRQGCTIIQAGIDQLQLQQMPHWQPDVRLSPVTSTTLQISVTTAMDGVIQARLYPLDAPAPAAIALSKVNGVYTGNFVLNEAALDGHLQVIAQIQGQEVEVVTAYALGGNPVRHHSRRVRHHSRRAPAISADGQVVVYGEQFDNKQDEEWIFTVQTASTVPHTPPWATLVGQGYWLLATPNAPNLQGATISFYYLGDSVPAGEERFLRIYYREEKQAALCPFASQQIPCWRPLETTLDTFYNFAAAELQGPGLYALMSSIEMPLTGARWNLFAYPVQGSRPVAEALQSIHGAYSMVWGYETGSDDPWRFYVPDAPTWVNDPVINGNSSLKDLEFGKGYWLYVTKPETITLYLKGNAGGSVGRSISALGLPGVYYGTLAAESGFTPAAGMKVTASIDGKSCGTAQTKVIDSQKIGYVVKVAAEDGTPAHSGCGLTGRTVTLQVEGISLLWQVPWNNSVENQVATTPVTPMPMPTPTPTPTVTPTPTPTVTPTPTPTVTPTPTPTVTPTPTPTPTVTPAPTTGTQLFLPSIQR